MSDIIPRTKREGRDLMGFRNEIDNLFNRFFDIDLSPLRSVFKESDWSPKIDIVESEKEITVLAEIPGCDVKDIDVSLTGNRLSIKGEKKKEKEEKTEGMHRIERSYGSFSRIVQMPVEVDQETIDATYRKGILKLVFKKIQETASKKIQIKTS